MTTLTTPGAAPSSSTMVTTVSTGVPMVWIVCRLGDRLSTTRKVSSLSCAASSTIVTAWVSSARYTAVPPDVVRVKSDRWKVRVSDTCVKSFSLADAVPASDTRLNDRGIAGGRSRSVSATTVTVTLPAPSDTLSAASRIAITAGALTSATLTATGSIDTAP